MYYKDVLGMPFVTFVAVVDWMREAQIEESKQMQTGIAKSIVGGRGPK